MSKYIRKSKKTIIETLAIRSIRSNGYSIRSFGSNISAGIQVCFTQKCLIMP